ncbi:hypothetical protein NC652_031627 [Populus alba x Populus x berolinensis]|nr:hypothetical protein NC652_031627 [Populus alba x Populus x berolinensis]
MRSQRRIWYSKPYTILMMMMMMKWRRTLHL